MCKTKLSRKDSDTTMDYKIAICDDSINDAKFVANYVMEWSKKIEFTIQLEMFHSAEEFLFHYEENKNYDILLLDIEMGEMDGVSLAKKLRRENEILQIIFITGYSDYISEGYEVSALHYLIKPVKKEKLFDVLNRAYEKLKKDDKILTFDIAGEIVRIPVYQIRYADVQMNYITIYAKQKVTIKMTLSKLVTMLDERFYRVGRASVVNLTFISRVTKTDIYLQDGSRIPLPRGSYDGVNRAIINMR